MTDVVVDRQLVEHLALTVVPLGDHRININRGVGYALLRVVLRVQRTQADIDGFMQRILECDDGDAVRVLAFKFLSVDGILDLVPSEYPGVAVEITGYGDVFTVRRDVDTVRALGLGYKV